MRKYPPESQNTQVLMQLAASKMADRIYEAALSLYEKAFIASPQDEVAREYHLAITKLEAFHCAESVFQNARDLNPESRTIQYLFIDILLKQGKFEAAFSAIKQAMASFGVEDGMLRAAQHVKEKLGASAIERGGKSNNAVSLCMIVKDEETCIAKCLQSVESIVDEIIVVDTGSSDSTKEIADVFGAKVYDFTWCDDFAKARNFSIAKASGDWILALDADEVISPLDHAAFRRLAKKTFSAPVAFSFETRNYTMLANRMGWVPNDGTYHEEVSGIGWLPSVKVRLFPNKPGIGFTYPIHELVEPALSAYNISIEESGIPVHHYGKLDEEKTPKKGEAYYRMGVKKLDELEGNLFALQELAVQAGELERYEEAIKLWQSVLSLQPDIPEAFINQGSAYWQMEQYEDALLCAEKAISLDPNLKEAHFNCAVSLLLLGRAKEAVSVLENLILHVPEYLAAQFMLASAGCCIGKKEQSRGYISALAGTKLGPGLGAAFHDLAKRLLAAGRIQYAQSVIDTALEIGYRNNELLDLR